jgi:light-regulated signal transduction histidine kinase (bacteriophytochrome)
LDNEQFVILEANSDDPAIASVFEDFIEPNSAQTALAVRIITDGGLGGVISLNASRAREWKDDEIRYALAMASQICIALATAERISAEKALAEVNVHLDKMVRDRTAELEIANKELDAFARTLSHDLKNPVATIETNCWLMRDQFQDQLGDSALKPLARIEGAAKRMKEQITAMLKLYHLSQEEIVRELCDLTGLAKAIIAEIETGDSTQKIEVTIQEFLVDEASPELVKTVLDNLLSNAIKYSSKREAPRIEFGAAPPDENEQIVYHVRDNGAGFDMRNADKLFGLFQRLHSSSQFEGTGVGLASVQRVIQNHGGRIWAESEPDKGATFYFTLQSAQAARDAALASQYTD